MTSYQNGSNLVTRECLLWVGITIAQLPQWPQFIYFHNCQGSDLLGKLSLPSFFNCPCCDTRSTCICLKMRSVQRNLPQFSFLNCLSKLEGISCNETGWYSSPMHFLALMKHLDSISFNFVGELSWNRLILFDLGKCWRSILICHIVFHFPLRSQQFLYRTLSEFFAHLAHKKIAVCDAADIFIGRVDL